MESDPWEALDLELEDSLLVSRKRNNPISPIKHNNRVIGPRSCSLKSQSQSHSIPGPAGAVQSAMQRKCFSTNVGDENPISTQEYIRRAMEDPGHEDEDFSRHPWLSAVDFVRRQGLVGSDGVAIGKPLCEIKSGMDMEKVSQIVAIVKSSTPNGFGDMLVTLKDPTGTVDASIHHKVITEGEFGKDISVGAVLILQKVAVFSPSHSRHYLNITLGNILKVISKDTESPSEQDYPSSMVKHAATDVESSGKLCMLPKACLQSKGRTEGIMNHFRQNTDVRSSQDAKEMKKVNLASPSSFCGAGAGGSQNFVVEKDPFVLRQDVIDGMNEVADGTAINGKDQGITLAEPLNLSNQVVRGNLLGDIRYCCAAANDQENGNINAVKSQRQLLISKGSLPQWTDEQLDELLTFD